MNQREMTLWKDGKVLLDLAERGFNHNYTESQVLLKSINT